jgi:hypothetical protein
MAGLSFALLFATIAPGQDTPAGSAPVQGAPQGRGGAAAAPTSVGGAMKGMGRALRGLQASIADPAKRDDNLKSIGEMQRNCIAAKSMSLPSDVMKSVTDPAERTKLQNAYRADLIKVARALLDLEQLVVDGKGDQAKVQLEGIIKMRDAGHDSLGIKDE